MMAPKQAVFEIKFGMERLKYFGAHRKETFDQAPSIPSEGSHEVQILLFASGTTLLHPTNQIVCGKGMELSAIEP